MWICLDNENGTFATGTSPTDAYDSVNLDTGCSDFNECDFYEVTSPVKMKQEIVPKTVITPTINGPRKKYSWKNLN